MLPLHTQANVRGVRDTQIFKVLTAQEAAISYIDPERCLIWDEPAEGVGATMTQRNWAEAVSHREPGVQASGGAALDGIETPGVVAPGDVVRLVEGSSRVSVLYRRGSNSNTLLATERCNSFCVMCSQPPRDVDDRWLVDEMLEVIPLVDRDEAQLGISGGEPTLLGDDLLVVLHQARQHLPNTGLHILTNGRRFSAKDFARTVHAVRHPDILWGIPVYSDCPEVHDYVVQASGAWDETLEGLYNLAIFEENIEIRIVVQRANVDRLGELAYFIFRNLTFAKHVAFMGLEPMGFARTNYDRIWVDPIDCVDRLKDAVYFLSSRGMSVSLYNFPLCILPEELWRFARRSISDWKNIYLPCCDQCDVQQRCGGFFRTIDRRWMSRAILPIRKKSSVGSD